MILWGLVSLVALIFGALWALDLERKPNTLNVVFNRGIQSSLSCDVQMGGTCIGRSVYYNGNGTFYVYSADGAFGSVSRLVENVSEPQSGSRFARSILTGHGSKGPKVAVYYEPNATACASSHNEKKDSLRIVVCAGSLHGFSAPVETRPLLVFSVVWNNLFRTLYAGLSAWFTMHRYSLFLPGSFVYCLADSGEAYSTFNFLDWLSLAAGHSAQGSVIHWSSLKPAVYRTVIFGVSKHSAIYERTLNDRKTDPFFEDKKWVFQQFRERLIQNAHRPAAESSGRASIPRTLLISRREPSRFRLLVNEEALCNRLERCQAISFDDWRSWSAKRQVGLVSDPQVQFLIAVHGAGLSHLLFLRNSQAVAIEIFPRSFRKTVYQNLARLVGVSYVSYEARQSFHPLGYTGDRPAILHDSLLRDVNWSDQLSKDYYRSQNIFASLYQVRALIDHVSDCARTRYLLYAPFERLGNQVVEFKTACALASILNRTLVIPRFGVLEKNGGYSWIDFDRIFDLDYLLEMEGKGALGCSAVTLSNFMGLFGPSAAIDKLYYSRTGPKTIELEQVTNYYVRDSSLPVKAVQVHAGVTAFQLSGDELSKLLKRETARVLALGNVFWLYNFGVQVEYPLERYYYEHWKQSAVYRSVSRSLTFSAYHKLVYSRLLGNFVDHLNSNSMLAVHVRVGDYPQKCAALNSVHLTTKCYPSLPSIVKQISAVLDLKLGNLTAIYILGNTDFNSNLRILELKRLLKAARPSCQVVVLGDLLDHYNLRNPLFDAVTHILTETDLAVVDQLVAVQSDVFIGNIYSSFTRSIIDQRMALGFVEETNHFF